MTSDSIETLRGDLRHACQLLSKVNLYQAAKWCAEALNGLTQGTSTTYSNPQLDAQEEHEQDKIMLASTYFNCKDFERAAHTLSGCKSGIAVFMKLYSIYISIDKRETEARDSSINVISSSSVSNEKGSTNYRLSQIAGEADSYNSNPANQPNGLLYFLNGMICNKRKKPTLAQTYLVQSLELFPYNWSAWKELISCFTAYDEVISFINETKANKPHFASHIMFQFFEVVVLQEFYQQLPLLVDTLMSLIEIFPSFTFLKVQKFLIAYHSLDYYTAEGIFDQVLLEDPFRLDDLDTFSNMLYVMEKKPKLSFLAQFASAIDKYRPETCCIIANYHSMKCEHEKAIMYYKRALTLNKNCLSAWTLMGHEFVELKNSHAAIESYRRAVDTNPRDFRAWYGLGQAYEVLDMHLYALYYYQRATSLQPLDTRMWQAIGNCYEKNEKYEEAFKSFEKALQIESFNKSNEVESHEPHISYRLATLSDKIGNLGDTYTYMKLCLELEQDWGISDETSKARLWLARHALKNKRYEEAHNYAKDQNYNNAHDIEEARAIAREARSRMTA